MLDACTALLRGTPSSPSHPDLRPKTDMEGASDGPCPWVVGKRPGRCLVAPSLLPLTGKPSTSRCYSRHSRRALSVTYLLTPSPTSKPPGSFHYVLFTSCRNVRRLSASFPPPSEHIGTDPNIEIIRLGGCPCCLLRRYLCYGRCWQARGNCACNPFVNQLGVVVSRPPSLPRD